MLHTKVRGNRPAGSGRRRTSCGEYLRYFGAPLEMFAYNVGNCSPVSANGDCNAAKLDAHKSPCA